MPVITCLFTEHNLWLVALAGLVCLSGTCITFALYARARERSGLQKHGWAFLTAVASGCSIWSTHFIAMLAYDVRVPVSFDPVLTLASLVLAIAGCAAGFGLSAINEKRFPPEACGVVVGLSIALMHYMGMAAYRVSGLVHWDMAYVAGSIAVVTTFAAWSLHHAVRKPHAMSNYFAICLLVVGIVALHFMGMTALQVTPLADGLAVDGDAAYAAIAIAVAGAGLMVIGTGIATYLIDAKASEDTLQRLQHMALNDALTGLPNRVHFSNYLDQEVERAERHGWTLAVVGIDLNHFKEINDVRGHEAGDEVLKTVGRRLAAMLRPGEFTARVGGDEFAAVKRYDSDDGLHEFLARIEEALSEPVRCRDFESVTGGSIGVSLYPQDGRHAATLVSNVDLAMYRAKADSKGAICFYQKQMDETARDRKALRAELQKAIARDELELHYQVQNYVITGQVSGYEALLRWRHHDRGFVSPVHFIPIAEESGLIAEIGEWVLRTACREAVNWPEPYKIAVNVSAVQLARGNLAMLVLEILAETGLSPTRLELEITESAIVADRDKALEVLGQISALGVSLAIDDFGTGYSSLGTLRSFPFDKIKLDRAFTLGIETDAQSKAILRAVVAMGKSLGIPVLAEGVETSEQLSILRDEGCDQAQGFLLGRPGPDTPRTAPPKAYAAAG